MSDPQAPFDPILERRDCADHHRRDDADDVFGGAVEVDRDAPCPSANPHRRWGHALLWSLRCCDAPSILEEGRTPIPLPRLSPGDGSVQPAAHGAGEISFLDGAGRSEVGGGADAKQSVEGLSRSGFAAPFPRFRSRVISGCPAAEACLLKMAQKQRVGRVWGQSGPDRAPRRSKTESAR